MLEPSSDHNVSRSNLYLYAIVVHVIHLFGSALSDALTKRRKLQPQRPYPPTLAPLFLLESLHQ